MLIHDSCSSAIESCVATRTFAIARLYSEEKTMSIHIHDCYEVYFSISGGKQFLIDNRVYEFDAGDIFFINQFESHYLSKIDQTNHVRVVLCIHPEYLKRLSTEQTDLNYCFTYRDPTWGHKLSLSEEERKRFMYFIHKLSETQEFGQDVLDQAYFLELITFLNFAFRSRCINESYSLQDESHNIPRAHNLRIDEILTYIDQHLTDDISITMLASHFYINSSYLCKIFKDTTGTTINRYITAKRITRAKVLLSEGRPVTEVCAMCGFRDYSNFLKAFTKAVGISPKKYAAYTRD